MVNNLRREALLAVVAEWLEEGDTPPLVPRDHREVSLENLERILAVVGPRRAGKTYFMYQLIRSLLEGGRYTKEDILFVDFEDYRLSGFGPADVDELFAAFHRLAGRYPRFLFFDEVQHLPGWSRVLRTLHNRHRFRIIVSGSNSELLGREIATELRGRYEDLLLLPFSFREYLRCRGVALSPTALHTAARGTVAAAFDDYLGQGGFPEVVTARNGPERRRLLQNYYKTVFYRDILERYNIKARHLLEALMSGFLETYADVFSVSRFEKQLKANGLPGSKRTVANYLHHLREAFFIIVNERFSFSPRRRLMNPKKVYLADIGFASLGRSFTGNRGKMTPVSKARPQQGRTPHVVAPAGRRHNITDRGRLLRLLSKMLENLVAVELFRREAESYYFKSRNECDFVIRRGSRPAHAIQVCWELTAGNEKRELAGLVEACRSLDISSAVILTYAQAEERRVNGLQVSVLPVWRWLLEERL